MVIHCVYVYMYIYMHIRGANGGKACVRKCSQIRNVGFVRRADKLRRINAMYHPETFPRKMREKER